MNKYYQLLDKVLLTGKQQENKKGADSLSAEPATQSYPG